ncbi:zinc finger protein 84-like [Leptopilina heterotoma]|uniref:zinc finger protein 84-like n=1 Tax=Leptopilina heterotoma TaxID=63436 RepID=UPI001CA8AA48|nr:zinc finger protein 84-like [Leptopilina heterotoma]
MTTVNNWENTCRLCSEVKTEMLSIYGIEGVQRKVAQKLRACLPVLVYKTDPLPKQICQFCAARLDDAYEFREYCLNVYKTMHTKLLVLKNSESVQIFLNAMQNSPDPCQVQLCKEKCRAPPPLVPLPATLPIESTTPLINAPELLQLNNSRDPLPELPCEVQIKEEPIDTLIRADSDLLGLNKRSLLISGIGKRANAFANDYGNAFENNGESNFDESDKPRTSILEQVLKGNITLSDRKDQKSKTGLSSKWWCAPCNNYYRTKEGLIKHMQVFCPRRYTCRKCSRVFYTVEDLAKHDGTDHLKVTLDFDEVVTKCHQCDREFVSWEMLRHHRLRDHVAEDIDIGTSTWCPSCNRFFPSMETYQNHMQLHQLDTMTRLPISSLPSVSQENHTRELRKENLNDSVKSLSCPTCGKICTQQSALSNHMRTHEPKKHQCDICGRFFGLYIRLATHKMTEHNQGMMPVMTSIEQEEALNAEREAREAREARSRGKTRSYDEMVEEDDYSVNDTPVKRKIVLNSSSIKNAVRCGICLQWFNNRTEMIAHLQTHSDSFKPKSFCCKVCTKSFKEKWQLTRHEASHNRTTITTYTCTVCNEVFTDKSSYKAHQAKHSIDKTFHCAKCNKIFFKEFSLMTHQCTVKPLFHKKNTIPKTLQRSNSALFSGSKKYKCSKCSATFTNSQSRNSHMRVHSEAHLLNQVRKQALKKEAGKMPKLKPEASACTSVPRIEQNTEVLEVNPPAPVKRTLIKTAGGYRCGVCQSPFVLRELAVAHLRSAHPLMPYQCPYCKKRFTTQYTFTHHIKADHPDESEN